MVNEKCRQRVPAWDVFATSGADKFSAFFARVLQLALYGARHARTSAMRERVSGLTDRRRSAAPPEPRALPRDTRVPTQAIQEQVFFVIFLINAFQSLENALVRPECLRLVSLSTWESLSPARREQELDKYTKLRKMWKALQKQHAEASADKERHQLQRSFMARFFQRVVTVLEQVPAQGPIPAGVVRCVFFFCGSTVPRRGAQSA